MRNILLLGAIGIAGCRGDDEDGEGEAESEAEAESESEAEAESESEAEAEGDDVSIYAIQRGEIAVGTDVTVRDVVVTAVDAYDNPGTTSEDVGHIYVQEPDPDPTDGRKYSGIYVFGPARKDYANGEITDLLPGDLVTVRGTVDEFALDSDMSGRTMTEISEGTVEFIGETAAIAPADVPLSDFADDATSEPWEGVLIRVSDARAGCGVDEYGTFPAEGEGGWVDVSFDLAADPGVAFDECMAAVVGPLNYFFSYRIQPRGADDLAAGTGCPDLGMVDVADVQGGLVVVDTEVRARGVVTAIDDNPAADDPWGYWIQQGTGADSGLYVFGDEGDAVVGDEVVVSGSYTEWYDLSQIEFARTCRLGAGAMPAPEVLDAATAASEDWEGVLVRVEDVQVTNPNPDDPDDFGEFEIDGALRVDDDLYDYGDQPAADTAFISITGPIQFSFGTFKILPRTAADLVE